MKTIAEVIDIPESVHAGDFVLRLSEGVSRPERTLEDYVVTPALVDFPATLPVRPLVPGGGRPDPVGARRYPPLDADEVGGVLRVPDFEPGEVRLSSGIEGYGSVKPVPLPETICRSARAA